MQERNETNWSSQLGNFDPMIGINNRLSPYAPMNSPFYTIPRLYAAGENGGIYNPSYMTGLFQDNFGTTPVTATGQQVGLMLDGRFGYVRNLELISNTNFSNSGAGWAVTGADATHIATFANNTLRYQADTTTPSLNIGMNTDSAGKWIELTVVCSAWVSGGIKIGEQAGYAMNIGAVGTYRSIVPCTNTSVNITRTTANVDMTFSSISMREVPGNHATQVTATARPLWQADQYAKNFLYFDGIDDGLSIPLVGNNNGLAAWGVASLLPTGSRVILSNAAPGYVTCAESLWAWNNAGTNSPSTVALKARQVVSFITNGTTTATYADSTGVNGPASPGAPGNGYKYIGSFDGASGYTRMDLYGLVLRDAATTEYQAAQVRQMLQNKMGLVSL